MGGFSPRSGPFDSRVVITGQSYSNVSAVKFNGVSASFTINSATQVTAIVPRGATTGPISVTNPNGTAFSDEPFTIKHRRRVTLALSGSLRASGIVRVLDGTAACIDEVAVRIQRFVSGSWRTVGTTVTDELGSYFVRVANREGRHRARAPRFILDNGDVCARSTSPAVSNV
ncbi:MAG: IPT/TIG domain-containing protein [Actinomycetota bacterium]